MLRVRMLGELTIELDGSTVELPASRRARALLAWLALDRGVHSRSRLAARFWPDVLDESARTSLRSALSALRRALGPDGERYLIATRDEVGLAGDSLVWTDLSEFGRCVEAGRLKDALAIGRGELLPGLDDDWVYERRDEHRDLLSEVLSRLAAAAEQEGNFQAAIEYTRQQVALDPLAEEPHRDLMRRLAAAGDRAAALRVFERLSRRLRDELRLAPGQETRELAETLRGSEVATPERAAAAQPGAAVVTLLFTDLVGSTELLSELGDDEAEQLRRVHFGLLRDVATAHGGEEVKNLGDGLMVAFASAVNALSCAIGIQQAVHRHNARQGDDRLRVRVGLHIGEPIRDEGDYFGTPVVIAKRLCDSADGGQILASELLRALVGSRGSFAFRSCGPMSLKGIAEPLPACEIAWEPAPERRIPLPPPLPLEGQAALVGRGTELAALQRCWQDAQSGQRVVAVLVGEPGIGKTRLAAEFCRDAYEEGALVLMGRCYEDSLVPYQAFVEALRHYVTQSPIDELRLALGPHRATLAKLLPELADATAPAPLSSPAEAPEREQFMLFDAVASLLRAVTGEHPLMLVLDDLHWADASTLLLLRHVVRATEETPIMIMGTYRETEVDEAHPLAQMLAELRRGRVLVSVPLRGLGEDEITAMISTQSGRSAPATVARSILDRTQGNPFFIEELLRGVSVDDDWTDALTRIGIPQSVKDLLVRRMRRLDDAGKRVLTLAAVSGREFALDVLEQVVEMPALSIAETLERAIEDRIVEESTSSIGRYSFAHALIREAIYEQVSHARRAQLHRQIGQAIEHVAGDRAEEQASMLAYHFSAAGDLPKAYEHHARAAAGASAVYAVEPALAHYSAALGAGANLGLDLDQDSALRELQLQRGRMRYRTGDFPGAAADFEAVLGSARRAGDRATEMEALNELGILRLQSDLTVAAARHEAALDIARELDDDAAQTQALNRLAVISSHLLEFERALELGERALELARGTGDPIVAGLANDSIKLAVWQLGELARLEGLTGELEALWRERGDLWYLQFTVLESAFVPLARARWDEAAARMADAVAINRRVHDSQAEMLMLDAQCWLHRSRGAYEQALSAGRRAVALSTERFWEGWPAATLGWTLLDVGAAAEAAEVLERGVAAGKHTGAPNHIVRCLGQLAWARWLLGAHDEAKADAARAERLLQRVAAPKGTAFLFGAQAYAATARVLLATGAPERAAKLVRAVSAAAGRTGWCEMAAITSLVLGLCLETRGELAQARATIARAAELSDEHGIPAPGWEAHAALARLARGTDEAEEHAAAVETILERMSAGLTDEGLVDRLRERATA